MYYEQVYSPINGYKLPYYGIIVKDWRFDLRFALEDFDI